MTKKESRKVHDVKLGLIDRPEVPDRISIDPEYIKDLTASIKEIGLRNPIELVPRGNRYEIVQGDCRVMAFNALLQDTIPAFISELTEEEISVIRATENLQRKDLTIIEEAKVYSRLHNTHSMSWEQIAKRTGKSPGLVKRRCDLLKMPEILINALHERKISYTVAEELMRLQNIGKIEYYLSFCIDHGATQRVVQDWVKEEFSRERQSEAGAEGGSWGASAFEQKPIYVSCDLCAGPMEISQTVSLRICQLCHVTIKQNM